MRKEHNGKGYIVVTISLLCCSILVAPDIIGVSSSDYSLPPPLTTDMTLEESIMRRMSIREFTDEPVTNEELATVLWAAHGLRDDGKRTTSSINNIRAAIIYVLKEDAAYTYDPLNHSLVHYKDGDWRKIVGWQYEAPIQLGLCWNTDLADINFGAAEIGQMCVNIYFMANALNLGTVACGQYPPAIKPLGIPDNQDGILVMPLGHPLYPYTFTYAPRWLSPLPKIQYSEMTLSEALTQRDETTVFTGEITEQQESQLLWAAYGYSIYLDKSDNTIGRLDRHRSIPSAHGYYPNDLYVVKETGIFRYYPNFYDPIYGLLRGIWFLPVIPFAKQITQGDFRTGIAQASSNPDVATSPFIVIPVLDDTKANRWDDLSGEEWRWLWYHDASASAHNLLLEATSQGLIGAIVLPEDVTAIRSILNLKDNQTPLLIVPVSSQ
jgi:nitroreductase